MTATEAKDAPVGQPFSGEGQGAVTSAQRRGKRRRRRISLGIFVGLVLIAVGAGTWFYIVNWRIASTDDAFIAADVYQIAPKVEGRLVEVPVCANQMVEAGQLLARIDPADFEWRVKQAQAAVELAEAQRHEAEVQIGLVESSTSAAVATADAEKSAAEAKLQQDQADLDAAKSEAARASADLERYSKLSDQAVSQQRMDLVRSTAQSAASAVQAAEKRVAAAESEVSAASVHLEAARADTKRVEAARAVLRRREAEVSQAQAVLEQAKLDLSYTRIIAPAAGRVTKKAIEPGDYVGVGRNLMALVSPDAWVEANFKETQLRRIRPGQPATIHVDAYDIELKGHVESIQAGSGAAFSLLPPQNATGNYVKVVQRVPVKIVFDDPAASDYLLGPGMSVVPRVNTR